MNSNRILFGVYISSLLVCLVQGFGVVPTNRRLSSSSSLTAVIYDWQDDGKNNYNNNKESRTTTPYNSFYHYDANDMSCSPMESALAQSLNEDPYRRGLLARLAVAFSPQRLRLNQLEHVDVVCVHADSIEIQAIVCEDGSCVSLSVPIRFPKESGGGGDCRTPAMYGDYHRTLDCILENMEELDRQAESVLISTQMEQEYQDLSNYDNNAMTMNIENLPPWWIPVNGRQQPELMEDCTMVQNLLNEKEFQYNLCALAQMTLRQQQQSTNKNAQGGRVEHTRVVLVGPAGLIMEVLVTSSSGNRLVLQMAHPFRVPVVDPESLRAAVLGAMALAEG